MFIKSLNFLTLRTILFEVTQDYLLEVTEFINRLHIGPTQFNGNHCKYVSSEEKFIINLLENSEILYLRTMGTKGFIITKETRIEIVLSRLFINIFNHICFFGLGVMSGEMLASSTLREGSLLYIEFLNFSQKLNSFPVCSYRKTK